MFMVAHLSWDVVLLFIEGKLSGCGWEFKIMLMVTHLSWLLVL